MSALQYAAGWIMTIMLGIQSFEMLGYYLYDVILWYQILIIRLQRELKQAGQQYGLHFPWLD